ncbi:hypothetical protein KAK05_00560, partial [Candidatus Parcubacteria bacterium]|nr:hypothetical protein [Candidatus Parcubacteria bacterium]
KNITRNSIRIDKNLILKISVAKSKTQSKINNNKFSIHNFQFSINDLIFNFQNLFRHHYLTISLCHLKI